MVGMSQATSRAEQASADNEYPDYKYGSAASRRARESWRARELEIRTQLAHDLGEEFAADLPEVVRDRMFQWAWRDAHSSGYHEVGQWYEELAEFARFVRSAK